MDLYKKKYLLNGYVIVSEEKIVKKIHEIQKIFFEKYYSKFENSSSHNLNLIKAFSKDPHIINMFLDSKLLKLIKSLGVKYPIFCSPVVSHFTSKNKTGNKYKLPPHQDFPSMASSLNSIIVWIPLFDINNETHGISVKAKSHLKGILPGEETQTGYYVTINPKELKPLHLKAGHLLIMSPFLVHSTFLNSKNSALDFKLAFSARYDDLENENWKNNHFQNAYQISVDRSLYKKII
jgi:hypothetical protein